MIGLVVIAAAGAAAILAGYVLWWSANRPALWNFVVAGALGLIAVGAALLIAYLMTWARPPLS